MDVRELLATRGQTGYAYPGDLERLAQRAFRPDSLAMIELSEGSDEKLIKSVRNNESVHPLLDRADLVHRTTANMVAFVLTHPSIPTTALAHIWVALGNEIASNLDRILDSASNHPDKETAQPSQISAASFYGISSSQPGAQRLGLGEMLIAKAGSELAKRYGPQITTATLSPLPGLSKHMIANQIDGQPTELVVRKYLGTTDPKGKPIDPVARFHLRNGASLFRVNLNATTRDYMLKDSHGAMVNYLYDPAKLASNARAYANNEFMLG